jgi:excinuclease ABC subunit A
MNAITIANASVNNLKNIFLTIPLNKYVVFVGRSGSGKSTLAEDVIMAGYIKHSRNVSVPVKPALFKQQPLGYTQKHTLIRYMAGETDNDDIDIYLSEYLKKAGQKSQFPASDLVLIAKKLSISFIKMNKYVSDMSLSEYNKCRFMKLIFNSNAQLFIVDELAAGLSYSDALGVADALKHIVSLGSSVIVIDHSMPLISASDFVVELGPFAGDAGGQIMFSDTTKIFKKTKRWEDMNKAYNEKLNIELGSKKLLKIDNINFHSFINLDITIPLDGIVSICGITGSGKSSLLDIILRAYDKSTNAWKNRMGIDGEIAGKNYIRRPYIIDQNPIGKNSMSTPATYAGIMDGLRNIYLTEAQNKGLRFGISDFSYNADGKCSACNGSGYSEIEINEERIHMPCPDCNGSRYNKRMLTVKESGFSIGELLRLSCERVYEIYSKDIKKKFISEKIKFINEVGLSYLALGQPSSALSGGESQRIKITKELAKRLGDRCLFILDSPAKGLHVEDMANILRVLKRLVSKNNSIIIGENQPFFVVNSDWIIYLENGKITYSGKPVSLPKKYKEILGIGAVL